MSKEKDESSCEFCSVGAKIAPGGPTCGLDEKDASGKSVMIEVPEMDCNHEVAQLEELFSEMKGVDKVNYYVVNREIKVFYDPELIGVDEITDGVKYLGMTAKVKAERLKTSIEPESGIITASTIISGLALVLAVVFSKFNIMSHFALPLFVLAIVTGGWNVFRRAVLSARNLNMDMNVLMIIAVGGAVYLKDWSEAAMVVFLFSVANLLESHTIGRARNAIRELMELTPEKARVLRNGETIEIPPENVKVGDHLLVYADERIPLDGKVIKGRSSVNQAPITGESMPVEKSDGDGVFAGAINQEGVLEIEVTHGRLDTQIARIVEMVEEAQARKAPAQNFVDRFTKYYTPAVIAAALLVVVVPVFFFNAGFNQMFYRAMVLLLISCPCALVISTPVSIVTGLTAAARNGVLIKGGLPLENMAAIDTVAMDKTGTLTEGKPSVSFVKAFNGAAEEEALQIAASVESPSNHPIAKAIVQKAHHDGIKLLPVEDFKSETAAGVRGTINGKRYFIGRHSHLCKQGKCPAFAHEQIRSKEDAGVTVAILACEDEPIGMICITDALREDSVEVVERLKKEGVGQVLMLTGDNKETAKALAEQLKIDYRAELLPGDKVQEIHKLVESKKKVAMIGDGVNDAPALAAATLGVAMGAAGTDIALEVADVALLSDDLKKLPFALNLSRRTLSVIKQNVALAVGIKLVFLILGIAGMATLWMAVFADMGASLLVILNGLRLLKS